MAAGLYLRRKNKRMEDQDIKKELDEVVQEIKNEGIDLENYETKSEGLGDTLEKIFTKFGITEDRIKKYMGIEECGCKERKKFLNKIFPYRKK